MVSARTYHLTLGPEISITACADGHSFRQVDSFKSCNQAQQAGCLTVSYDALNPKGSARPPCSVGRLRQLIILLAESMLAMDDNTSLHRDHHSVLAFQIYQLDQLIQAYKNRRVCIDDLVREIRINIKQIKGVKEVASSLGISERQVYIIFKQDKGISPARFIREEKLRFIAQELKTRGSRTITEVATDYGFTNMGRFSALYRAQTGSLPSEH